MDFSTPLVSQNDLRRKTLLKNTQNVSPLRKSLNISITQTPVLEITNDENERSNRRNSIEMRKRLSNLPQNNAIINESYVKQQFVICTHLYTENKINTKNVWKLQIIDMLRPLCQKSNKDTLQIASTSIDISAKVYSLRVDDVHADGLKLAGNMARVIDKESMQEQGDGNDGNENSDDPDQANRHSKKKKKKKVNLSGNKNTVSTKTVGESLPKLEPIDFTTRVNAETGQIDNLFTNVLKEDNSCYTFVLLDKNKTLFEDTDILIENQDPNTTSIKLFDIPKIPNIPIKINPRFDDFRVHDWDPDQEDQLLNVEKQIVFDDNGIPIPELDGSIHDIFENDDQNMDNDINENDDIQSIHEEMGLQLRGDVAHIADFRSVKDSNLTSEYSFNSIINTYNGKFIDQIWAGPFHWKLKFLRRSTMRFSGQRPIVKENRQGRKRHLPDPIGFQDVDYSMKSLKIKKRPPAVDINKITLPVQNRACIKTIEKINELMLKSGVCPVEKKTVEENQLDYEVDPYKYENPNDSLYCSQNTGDDNNEYEGDGNNYVSEVEEQVLGQHNMRDNMVEAPQMVSKWNVVYALKAKQMDMKKLKTAIWQKLTNSNNFILSNVQGKNTVIPQTFSEMYKHLPNLLADKERKELTCPLAFVALLHLCNEQNLHLTQQDNYKDFHIRSA